MKENNLLKLRKQNGYSQSILANILGISRQTYIKYESGELEPPLEVVRKLCKLYQVPYEFLIDGSSGSNSVNKNVEYKIRESPVLNVAKSSVPYSVYSADKSSFVSAFSDNLAYLQNVISSMQRQLDTFKAFSSSAFLNSKEETMDFSKSRTFDKEKFFAELNKISGTINFDSSYVSELREISKI